MAEIELRNISKQFGSTSVLRNVSFTIHDGEFAVLVGPSGCGKSTILRIIAGLETPTTGDIRIGGSVVNQVAARDRDIAMVFQNYALYPHMTVFDNMAFGLKMRKLPKSDIEHRVHEAAEFLHLDDLLRRKPRQLSGGQRQRVALGRALVRNPRAFLFDEPLSNLDAKLRTHTRTELARLHKQLGTTMVYVTHDQVEAMTLGQRIIVLKDGEVQQVDAPLEVYRRPANRFVAGFIGSPAMNFLPGTRTGDQITCGSLRFALPHIISAKHSNPTLIIGLRPEQLLLQHPGSTAAKLDVTVEVVEPLGNEILIYARFESERLVIRAAPATEVKPDDHLPVYFDPNAIHYFDGATDAAIQ
ncbi:sn-glycerol-3-phosphate ABC transporter ATP-binding protein UgpC [bacterium]|nr:sn-glycerol-3-phosphate ABC transporter ATP-binding protein UgpC [bacterium]MBU1984416.1 sn-glycerol-3-phosphate ABC transporter ATP-binding protein UgpC [bacterium]